MPLQPLTQRVAEDLVFTKPDKAWSRHKLPVDNVRIPADHVPDADIEFNMLMQENEKWVDNRPIGFCFDHAHSVRR